MARWEGDVLVLSTGKELYAHGGVLGVMGDTLTYGYDGFIRDSGNDLSREEQLEIAALAISDWNTFIAALGKKEG